MSTVLSLHLGKMSAGQMGLRQLAFHPAKGHQPNKTERHEIVEVVAKLLQKVLNYQSPPTASTQMPDNPLSERETEVLKMVADGARNKEIAYQLGITERTVKAHLSHIFQKLNVDSRAAAVAEAARAKLF